MNFTVKIDKEGFTGEATLDFPTREEKMKLLRELQALGYGAQDMEDETKMNDAKLALASKMGEVVDARLVAINVKHTESETEITDKAMLDIYTEGQVLVGLLSQFLLGGIPLGKPKS